MIIFTATILMRIKDSLNCHVILEVLAGTFFRALQTNELKLPSHNIIYIHYDVTIRAFSKV